MPSTKIELSELRAARALLPSWRALSAALLAATALACAGAQKPPAPAVPDALAQLRERAGQAPDDVELQLELAAAELFGPGGDSRKAQQPLTRLDGKAADDPRLPFLRAEHAILHGSPKRALEGYVEALRRSSQGRTPLTPALAEASVRSMADLMDGVADFRAHVTPVLEALDRRPGVIGMPALDVLRSLLIELALRRGDPEAAAKLVSARGCLRSYRVAGPFGDRELLGFDADPPALGPGAMAERYRLGERLGEQATRSYSLRGCGLELGREPDAVGPGHEAPRIEPGVSVVESTLRASQAGSHGLRVQTPAALRVRVDGREVLRVDRRRQPAARVLYVPLELSAGEHELELVLASRGTSPSLAVSLLPEVRGLELPAPDAPLSRYLRAKLALERGDAVTARETLLGVPEAQAPAPLLVLAAVVAGADPLRPQEQAKDDARRLLRAARERDPEAWYPPFQLANLASAEGRGVEAIDLLTAAEKRWVEVVGIPLVLAARLAEQDWDAEAVERVERARALVPDGCPPLEAALGSALARQRTAEAESLVQRLMECDARQEARYRLLLRTRRFEEAGRELERLASLSETPPWTERLELARRRGDMQAVEQLLERSRAAAPDDPQPLAREVDLRLGQGQRSAAETLLRKALVQRPGELVELRRLSRALFDDPVLEPYRLDGRALVKSYEASGRSYAGPEVLVLDYTVLRVFEDGSSLELTHNVLKVQSQEAVDQEGEFELPSGARLLRLRTLKADGRALEPDQIAGKDSISLPSLSPGDYVEFEYVRAREAPTSFPRGYLGDRFYFASFEVPFHHSQFVAVLPEKMEPLLDPRGPLPKLEEKRQQGLRVLSWTAKDSPPLVAEPLSVTAAEFLPSVRVGVNASWAGYVDSLRDLWIDKDPRDPAALRLVQELTQDAQGAEAKARALYRWVVREIEPDDALFGTAPAMLAARSGERNRVLRYLLELAGLKTDLALVRSRSSDTTPSKLVNPQLFGHLLLHVETEKGTRWLWTAERNAAFGYVPETFHGEPALLVREGAPQVQVPAGPPDAERRSLVVDVHLAGDGGARFEVLETLRGARALGFRNDLQETPPAELERRFAEGYVVALVPGAELRELAIRGRDEPEQPLELRYVFDVPRFGLQQEQRWTLPALLPHRLSGSYARLAQRRTTELVAPPQDAEVRIRLHADAGVELPEPAPSAEVAGPGGSRFEQRARSEHGALVLERRLRLPLMRVEPAQYPAFAEFCRKVDSLESRELRATLGGDARAARR